MGPDLTDRGDEFIEEVRERRRQVSAKFGNDVGRYFDELVRREKEHPERIAVPARSGAAPQSSTPTCRPSAAQ
jgi:hypothetical protein